MGIFGLKKKTRDEIVSMFEVFLDSVHNGIIAIDNEGEIVLFNSAGEKMLGLKKEDVIGRNVREVISDSMLLETLETGYEEIGQKMVINNKEIYSNRTPVIDQTGIIGAIAVFQDLTEIKSLEGELTELKNSLNVLETVLDSAYEGIIVVDKNGNITKFNKAYEDFLGIKEEDILGKHVTDVIENTRMHIVAKNGKAEIGHVQKIQGHDMIASRIPIKENGEIIGAVGKVLFQDVEELRSLAQRMEVLENRLNYYKSEIKRMQEAKYSFENIITENKQMNYLKKIARRAAESNSTILIQGESGTGKELFAHAIHKASYRKYGSFVRVNCAAIPRDLLESELFGYEPGAFTGAKKGGKPGKFELAEGGTIFLDEIGAMPISMQAKILRVLQEKEFERVGGTRTISLDTRVIAATNENLDEAVNNGDFREDLFYRINVIRLQLPPLRERKDDIPVLADSILKDLLNELQMEPKKFSSQTIKKLIDYDWPGNIRELYNYIERAINFCPGKIILPKHLPPVLSKNKTAAKSKEIGRLNKVIAEAEIEAIKDALSYTDGNRTEAAKLLGIHRTSLYQKISKYKIDISDF